MARPTLIIGLGGTGQWVLTYLKKDLLEIYGEIPENVKLIAYDTVTQPEVQQTVGAGFAALTESQKIYEGSEKKIGNVSLEIDTDLYHIGGNVHKLGEEIKAGLHPHLDWFDAEYWLQQLSDPQWYLESGAGRIRQFGLLAVYNDLMKGDVDSTIRKTLPAAITTIQNAAADEEFEVIVVGSVAGGTGSAMITPIGLLVRKLASPTAKIKLRAIVVLPSAFTGGLESRELNLRGGAALRELARAMVKLKEAPSKITFVPNHPVYGNVDFSRPFEGIYFVEGMRDGQPLGKSAAESVFPSVALWLRQIIDSQAGSWFTSYIDTNRAGSTMDPTRQREGVFGTFGVYTMYTPEYYLRETFHLRLAQEVIKEATNPIEEGGRRILNPAPEGMALPREAAIAFFENPASYTAPGTIQPETITPTNLIHEFGTILRKNGKADQVYVSRYANAFKTGDERAQSEAGWGNKATIFEDLPRYAKAKQEVTNEQSFNFVNQFRPSDQIKDKPTSDTQVDLLTHGIDNFLHDHHGVLDESDWGSYGRMADACMEAHVNTYRDLLQVYLLSVLTSNDRLGYAMELAEEFRRKFEEGEISLLAFIREVEKNRNALGTRVTLQADMAKARAEWEEKRTTTPNLWEQITNKGYSKDAIAAERKYLTRTYRYVRFAREYTLHNKVLGAAMRMLEITRAAAEELDRWGKTLLDGASELGIKGLLGNAESRLHTEEEIIKQTRMAQEIESLQQVETTEDGGYVSRVSKEDKNWALKGFRWTAVEDEYGNLSFGIRLEPVGNQKGELKIPRRVKVMKDGKEAWEEPSVNVTDQINAENIAALSTVLGQRFSTAFVNVKPMVQFLAKTRPDYKTLATELSDNTRPLISTIHGADPNEGVCVTLKAEGLNVEYKKNLELALRDKITGSVKLNTNQPVEIRESEDPYRLTVLRARVNFMLNEFTTHDTCRKQYQTEIDELEELDAEAQRERIHLLRNFYTQKAEQSAVEFEAKRKLEADAFRETTPRMVALLEQKRRFETALQCWALGWLEEVEDRRFPGKYHWILKSAPREFWITPNVAADKRLGDFEAMEHLVLVGSDQHPEHGKTRMVKKEDGQLMPLWNWLQTELNEKNKANELRPAFEKALKDQNGLVNKWREKAGRTDDPDTEEVLYARPGYLDLADYAADYFNNRLVNKG